VTARRSARLTRARNAGLVVDLLAIERVAHVQPEPERGIRTRNDWSGSRKLEIDRSDFFYFLFLFCFFRKRENSDSRWTRIVMFCCEKNLKNRKIFILQEKKTTNFSCAFNRWIESDNEDFKLNRFFVFPILTKQNNKKLLFPLLHVLL
jgi:hypothetical protein